MSEKIPNRKTYKKVIKSPETLRKDIESVDLEPLLQVIHAQGKHFFSVKSWNYLKKRYRNFLLLCGLTGEPIVPTADLDVIWHAHILDTIKYHEDCEKI